MADEPARQPRTVRIVMAVLALLICIYGGAYCSLVTPGLMYRSGKVGPGPVYAADRSTQRMLDRFFWPVHQVDRIFRPSVWQVELSDDPIMRAL